MNDMNDMSRVWGTTLSTLRESGETMLHEACANLELVDITGDTIEITCRDSATFNLLTKHRVKLGKHVNIHKTLPSNTKTRTEIIETLQEIFGEKLTVKK